MKIGLLDDASTYTWAVKLILPKSFEYYNNLLISSKDNKLEEQQQVYFSPFSISPKYKIKEYINEHNITKRNKIEKSDTIVISNSFIQEGYIDNRASLDRYYYIHANSNEGKMIVDFFDNYFESTNDWRYRDDKWSVRKKYEAFLFDAKNNTIQYNIVHRNSNEVYILDIDLTNIEIIEGYILKEHHGNTRGFENSDMFNNLEHIIETNSLITVFEENILDEITKGLDIDFEYYLNLRDMLTSKSKDNHNLVMEILTNCNLNTSKPYILALINEFSNVIFNKGTKSNNYKGLLKQLGEYRNILGLTWYSFIKQMREKHPEYDTIWNEYMVTYLNKNLKLEYIDSIIFK